MISKSSERVDRYDWENIPTWEPMVPGKERRKPSTDQKKVRRQMRRSDYPAEVPRNSQDAVLKSWASRESIDKKYRTTDRPSLLRIRAQQVLEEGL